MWNTGTVWHRQPGTQLGNLKQRVLCKNRDRLSNWTQMSEICRRKIWTYCCLLCRCTESRWPWLAQHRQAHNNYARAGVTLCGWQDLKSKKAAPWRNIWKQERKGSICFPVCSSPIATQQTSFVILASLITVSFPLKACGLISERKRTPDRQTDEHRIYLYILSELYIYHFRSMLFSWTSLLRLSLHVQILLILKHTNSSIYNLVLNILH